MVFYDKVSRILKTTNGEKIIISIPRYRCKYCNMVRRILPNNLYPYKQYESEIIDGVCNGYITSETLGYEDYPCESTMARWKKETCKIKNINVDYIKK